MRNPTCEFCKRVSHSFCSNCGSPHCDRHMKTVPDGSEWDQGETGLVCIRCNKSRKAGRTPEQARTVDKVKVMTKDAKKTETRLYRVGFTIRGHVLVDARSSEDAREKAENLPAKKVLAASNVDEDLWETLGEEP